MCEREFAKITGRREAFGRPVNSENLKMSLGKKAGKAVTKGIDDMNCQHGIGPRAERESV